MRTNPFNLEAALAGEPVVLRDGTKAYIRHHETQVKTSYPLIGYVADGKTEGEVVSWTEDGRYYWDQKASVYNIVGMWVEPLVFEHWHLLREDINYLAKDGDGRWFGYRNKPYRGEFKMWNTSRCGGCYPLAPLNPTLLPECSWENSLMERPENV